MSVARTIFLQATLILIASIASFVTPALADDWTHFKATVLNISAAPAQILYCEGFADPYHAVFGADFANASDADLTAVRIRFDFFDSFGTLLHTERGDVSGRFTEGARIQNSGTRGGWSLGALHFPQLANVAEVRCSIEKTADSNGHVWTNAKLPAPAGAE